VDDAHTLQEAAMKKGFALTAALAIAATTFIATAADAQSRRSYRYYGGESYQPNWNAYGGQQDTRARGVRDPNSYDGRRTGQPRTCGSDFFRYDDRGVPTGPYCN
jgi:hypothetical protein